MPQPPRTDDEKGLSSAIASRTAHVVHLTHNDLDAVGADAIHRMKYGKDGVFTIWSSVGKFIALFSFVAATPGKGDTLSISDIGFQKGADTLAQKAQKNGWVIEWRDHHRWREEEMAAIRTSVSFLCVDTEVCATGIVARDLMPGNATAAEVARIVCDYDLWKHADPRSAVLGQVLQRKKNRDHVRDCLTKGIFTDPVIEAEYREIKAEMDEAMDKSLHHATYAGKKYRIVFAPLYGYPSETAHYIRNKKKTDIEVIIGKDGKFSLRSVPPISHLIAREFGGGGHPNAAGGSFSFTVIERFTWWLFKKSKHFNDFVRIAEQY